MARHIICPGRFANNPVLTRPRWELFRRRIQNAPADYPFGYPSHGPNDLMRFDNYRYRPNPPISNQAGNSNRYARLRQYAPADIIIEPVFGSIKEFSNRLGGPGGLFLCMSSAMFLRVISEAIPDDVNPRPGLEQVLNIVRLNLSIGSKLFPSL
jgi:hypothetical protein